MLINHYYLSDISTLQFALIITLSPPTSSSSSPLVSLFKFSVSDCTLLNTLDPCLYFVRSCHRFIIIIKFCGYIIFPLVYCNCKCLNRAYNVFDTGGSVILSLYKLHLFITMMMIMHIIFLK